MAATRKLELGDRQGRYPAQVPDREIDLSEQEHEDDAESKHARPRHLHHDVVEVVGGEEVRGLEAEEDDDQHQTDDDGHDAEVARLHVVVGPAPDPGVLLGLVPLGQRNARSGDVHVRAHKIASAPVSAMPETLVGMPAVMACTTSCWVVCCRS